MIPKSRGIVPILGGLLMWVFVASCGGGAYRAYNVSLSPDAQGAEEAFQSGEYSRALELYGRALKGYEAEKNDLGVLLCLERTGWIQRELGEYGRAMEAYRRAYPLGKRLHGDAAEIDAGLGDVYLFSGDSDRARTHYLRALNALDGFVFQTSYDSPPGADEIAEMVRKVKAIIHARDNLGTLHYFAGEYDAALENLHAADALIDRVLLVARHSLYSMYFRPPPDLYEGIGFCRTMMGAVYGEMGRLDEAREQFDAGRRAFVTANRQYGLMINRALRFKVEWLPVAASLGEAEFAEVEALLDEAEQFGALEVVWRVCFELGRAMSRAGRNHEAREYLTRAVESLEMTRARLREDTVKMMFAASVQDVYTEMIELLFTMGALEEGFDYLERAKARAFLDMLGGRSLRAAAGVDELLVQKERELQERIDALVLKLRMMRGPERKTAFDEYRRLIQERARVLESIKDQSLEYASTATVTTVPAQRIAARLDHGTALVSYFVGKNRVLIWVVHRDGISATSGEMGADDLSNTVTEYREAVAARRALPVEELGKVLSALLLDPVREWIEGADRLFIVPSRALHHLPFSTLPVARDRYLVQDHTIRMLPNASSLLYLDKEVTDDTERILAMGNPARSDGSADLVFAEKEVSAVAGRFPRPEVRTGADATESALKEGELVGRGVLHIAAHGHYDRREPLKSALLLSPDGKNDGNMEVVEVFALRMNPRLVVLSACESGIGSLEGGDEMQGLNRAFLYAGAGGVLASLWSVSDESTYHLMDRFYRELAERPAAEALQRAQLDVMESYPEPFHWGAFYLTGSVGP